MRDTKRNFQNSRALTVLLSSLFVPFSSIHGDEASITVDCSCETKQTTSWCETNIGEFQTLTYGVSGFQKPGQPLTDGQLAEFCRRHADAACLCDDVKHYSGKIRE